MPSEKTSQTMDLHTHVIEKKVTAKDYWKNVSAKKIDVVAITEHVHFDAQKAFDRVRAEKPASVVLVPGAELNTEIGHVLCYSPDERIYQHTELFEPNVTIETLFDTAKTEGFVYSCAHPWGYNQDSAAFLIGPKELMKLVKKYPLGIEAYNGMVGHLSDIIYESGWIRRPNNFLDFLQKNRVSRKIGVSGLSDRLKKQMDRMVYSYLNRITASIELGEQASFITAGSDAHSADRIGEGMLKMRTKTQIEKPSDVLELVQKKKDVTWCGVGVREVESGVFEKLSPTKIKRMELLDGIRYVAMRGIREKVIKQRKQKKLPSGPL